MTNQLELDLKSYRICRIGHLPAFRIEYNIGNNQTSIEIVCSKCIEKPAYHNYVLSVWCYNCKHEHDVSFSGCCISVNLQEFTVEQGFKEFDEILNKYEKRVSELIEDCKQLIDEKYESDKKIIKMHKQIDEMKARIKDLESKDKK